MDSAIIPFTPAPQGKDYYTILGVNRNATLEVINDAYNVWAGLSHPDQELYDPSKLPMSDLSQEEYWLLVNEAYEVLSNPAYRQAFDMVGEHGLKFNRVPPYGNSYRFSGDCMQIYDQFRASYYGVPLETRDPDGICVPPPNVTSVPVTLEELFFGTTKTVHYEKNITVEGVTKKVTETVSLYIVAGTVHGTVLVKPRMGHVFNHSLGDAHFVVLQLAHPVFVVQGAHLCATVPLSLKTALLGGMFKLKSIDGKQMTLLFNPPYCPNAVTKLGGEGMPIPNTNSRGDLIIRYTVCLPTNVPRHLKHDLDRLLDQCA